MNFQIPELEPVNLWAAKIQINYICEWKFRTTILDEVERNYSGWEKAQALNGEFLWSVGHNWWWLLFPLPGCAYAWNSVGLFFLLLSLVCLSVVWSTSNIDWRIKWFKLRTLYSWGLGMFLIEFDPSIGLFWSWDEIHWSSIENYEV